MIHLCVRMRKLPPKWPVYLHLIPPESRRLCRKKSFPLILELGDQLDGCQEDRVTGRTAAKVPLFGEGNWYLFSTHGWDTLPVSLKLRIWNIFLFMRIILKDIVRLDQLSEHKIENVSYLIIFVRSGLKGNWTCKRRQVFMGYVCLEMAAQGM